MERLWDDRFERVLRDVIPAIGSEIELAPDLQLKSLGASSLTLVQLLLQLEHEYEIEISDELLDFRIFTTPASLWEAFSKVVQA
ncbi:acyl carrier protein [Streptomyces umbrinus]|uniref:Acyl carrier protein n=1 Tax=Streptomyces umbrinus TaxID=67370 RepID=A0ABU0SMI6_9ACTN|nr:acyl carrier protein [Streptomyces umbrinus]